MDEEQVVTLEQPVRQLSVRLVEEPMSRFPIVEVPPALLDTPDCACKHCVDCCESHPGWFAPGEPERAAEFLGMPYEEFAQKRLATDWWENDYRAPYTEILAPAPVGREGQRYPSSLSGSLRCTFLTGEGRCQIHPVKPMECRYSGHGDLQEIQTLRIRIVKAWHRLQEGNSNGG